MAREPTSIIEAFACHPSAVVELRLSKSKALSYAWHGMCAHASELLVGESIRWPEAELFVHEHVRDYLTDSAGAWEHDKCFLCDNELRNLPAGKYYE